MPCYLFLLHNPLSQKPPVPKKALRCLLPKLSSSFSSHRLRDWFVFQECRFFVFLRLCFSFLKLSLKVSQDLQISEEDAKVLSNDPESDAYIDQVSFFSSTTLIPDDLTYSWKIELMIKDNVLDSRQPGHNNNWERVGSCNSPWCWYWVQVIREDPRIDNFIILENTSNHDNSRLKYHQYLFSLFLYLLLLQHTQSLLSFFAATPSLASPSMALLMWDA